MSIQINLIKSKQVVSEEEQENININKIHDFTEKYKKEKECFDKAVVRDLYSSSGKPVNEKRTWPKFKSTEEIVYERFMVNVSNVLTGEFWGQKDMEGNRIPERDGGANCCYHPETIIRVRTALGEEYLYSMGTIKGYDASGLPVELFLSKPEVWTRTTFHRERIYDPQTKAFFETVKGPSGTFEEYDLPFSAEAVQELYDKRDKSNRTAKPVSFIVKDEQMGMDVSVRWSSISETLNLFKEKSFTFLFNGEYIPAPVRADLRAQSDVLMKQGEYRPIPKIEETTTTTSTNTEDINAYS
jgi:hypothetical protein